MDPLGPHRGGLHLQILAVAKRQHLLQPPLALIDDCPACSIPGGGFLIEDLQVFVNKGDHLQAGADRPSQLNATAQRHLVTSPRDDHDQQFIHLVLTSHVTGIEVL